MEEGSEFSSQIRDAARFFYLLKDPLRLRLLTTLAQAGELTVSELVRAIRVSQPLISWHLARLRAAGLVNVERDGRAARYSVDLDEIERGLSSFRQLISTGGEN